MSIIIPAKNEEKFIGRTLDSIAKQKFGVNDASSKSDGLGNEAGSESFEVIVVSNSSDATESICNSYSFVKVISCNEETRGGLMNIGAKKASGEILFFLHPDTIIPKNAFSSILKAFENKEGVGNDKTVFGAFRVSFDHHHKFLAFVAWQTDLRMKITKNIYGDQSLFVLKSVFEKIGGFKSMKLFEDVEICSRLREEGKAVFLREKVVTSARRFLRVGVYKQSLINTIVKTMYSFGVSDKKLSGIYHIVKSDGANESNLSELLKDESVRLSLLFGGIGVGKTTASKYLQKKYECSIVSVREHYKKFIVPRFLKSSTYAEQKEKLNGVGFKELTFAAGDWIYSLGDLEYMKAFLEDEFILKSSNNCYVIDGLRLIQDAKYLYENFKGKVKLVVIDLPFEERVLRSSVGKEISSEVAIRRIEYEEKQYLLGLSRDYILGNGAVVIDNSESMEELQLKLDSLMEKKF